MLLTKFKMVLVALLAAGMLTLSTGTLIVPAVVGTAAGGENEKESRRPDSARAGQSLDVQVRIASPAGMKVSVLPAPGQGDKVIQVEAPGRLNLEPGSRTRLKLADIPHRPGVERYPTVEIPKADASTEAFVTTSAIPIEFTDADFDQVNEGKAITKVVYLTARPKEQKPAARQGEPLTIASYDCPERDVLEEANRRGSVLAVVRMGNIDLEGGKGTRVQGQGGVRTEKPDKPVEIAVGNDGIQGVVRQKEGNGKANDKENLAPHLARAMQDLAEKAKAVAVGQAENEALKQQLKQAELEIKALRTSLEQKERELQQMKKAKGADGN